MPESSRIVPEGRYFFPVVLLGCAFDEKSIESSDGAVSLARRLWRSTPFDAATLGAYHEVRFPYLLLDVYLSVCHLELQVAAPDIHEARERAFALRALLYSEGCPPFLMPFCANASVNDYSGINSRDSDLLRSKLPAELRDGPTSKTHKIHFEPLEMSLAIQGLPGAPMLDAQTVQRAIDKVELWRGMRSTNPLLYAFEGAITGAPQLASRSQAVLHLWTGLESLFPKINTEVTFRLALSLALLEPDRGKRRALFVRAKKAYGTRSRIAHGDYKSIGTEDWSNAWDLANSTFRALLARKALPTEDALLEEVWVAT